MLQYFDALAELDQSAGDADAAHPSRETLLHRRGRSASRSCIGIGTDTSWKDSGRGGGGGGDDVETGGQSGFCLGGNGVGSGNGNGCSSSGSNVRWRKSWGGALAGRAAGGKSARELPGEPAAVEEGGAGGGKRLALSTALGWCCGSVFGCCCRPVLRLLEQRSVDQVRPRELLKLNPWYNCNFFPKVISKHLCRPRCRCFVVGAATAVVVGAAAAAVLLVVVVVVAVVLMLLLLLLLLLVLVLVLVLLLFMF